MSRYMRISLRFLILAAVFWFVSIVFNPAGFEPVVAFAAIACSFVSVDFLAVGIFQKRNPKSSPYRVFAVINGLVGAGVLAYAIYDIQTDTGWFAGLVGTLLLVFVVPFIAVLLLADFILWRRNQPK